MNKMRRRSQIEDRARLLAQHLFVEQHERYSRLREILLDRARMWDDRLTLTKESMVSRNLLKADPEVKATVDKCWEVLDMHKNKENCICKEAYIEMLLKICRLLLPGNRFNAEEARRLAEDDWLNDTGTTAAFPAGHMSHKQFHTALFEIIDAWSPGKTLEEYVNIFRKLLDGIAGKADVGGKIWKADEQIEHDEGFSHVDDKVEIDEIDLRRHANHTMRDGKELISQAKAKKFEATVTTSILAKGRIMSKQVEQADDELGVKVVMALSTEISGDEVERIFSELLFDPRYGPSATLPAAGVVEALHRLGLQISEAEVLRLWPQFSTNGDGRLNLLEFRATVGLMQQRVQAFEVKRRIMEAICAAIGDGRPLKTIFRLFQLIDKKRDSRIEPEEMRIGLTKLHLYGTKIADEMGTSSGTRPSSALPHGSGEEEAMPPTAFALELSADEMMLAWPLLDSGANGVLGLDEFMAVVATYLELLVSRNAVEERMAVMAKVRNCDLNGAASEVAKLLGFDKLLGEWHASRDTEAGVQQVERVMERAQRGSIAIHTAAAGDGGTEVGPAHESLESAFDIATLKSVAQRYQRMDSPRIQAAVQDVWIALGLGPGASNSLDTTRGRSADRMGRVLYVEWATMVSQQLQPDLSEEDAMAQAQNDWQGGGIGRMLGEHWYSATIGFASFLEIVVELCVQWVYSGEEEDYVKFVEYVLVCVVKAIAWIGMGQRRGLQQEVARLQRGRRPKKGAPASAGGELLSVPTLDAFLARALAVTVSRQAAFFAGSLWLPKTNRALTSSILAVLTVHVAIQGPGEVMALAATAALSAAKAATDACSLTTQVMDPILRMLAERRAAERTKLAEEHAKEEWREAAAKRRSSAVKQAEEAAERELREREATAKAQEAAGAKVGLDADGSSSLVSMLMGRHLQPSCLASTARVACLACYAARGAASGARRSARAARAKQHAVRAAYAAAASARADTKVSLEAITSNATLLAAAASAAFLPSLSETGPVLRADHSAQSMAGHGRPSYMGGRDIAERTGSPRAGMVRGADRMLYTNLLTKAQQEERVGWQRQLLLLLQELELCIKRCEHRAKQSHANKRGTSTSTGVLLRLQDIEGGESMTKVIKNIFTTTSNEATGVAKMLGMVLPLLGKPWTLEVKQKLIWFMQQLLQAQFTQQRLQQVHSQQQEPAILPLLPTKAKEGTLQRHGQHRQRFLIRTLDRKRAGDEVEAEFVRKLHYSEIAHRPLRANTAFSGPRRRKAPEALISVLKSTDSPTPKMENNTKYPVSVKPCLTGKLNTKRKVAPLLPSTPGERPNTRSIAATPLRTHRKTAEASSYSFSPQTDAVDQSSGGFLIEKGREEVQQEEADADYASSPPSAKSFGEFAASFTTYHLAPDEIWLGPGHRRARTLPVQAVQIVPEVGACMEEEEGDEEHNEEHKPSDFRVNLPQTEVFQEKQECGGDRLQPPTPEQAVEQTAEQAEEQAAEEVVGGAVDPKQIDAQEEKEGAIEVPRTSTVSFVNTPMKPDPRLAAPPLPLPSAIAQVHHSYVPPMKPCQKLCVHPKPLQEPPTVDILRAVGEPLQEVQSQTPSKRRAISMMRHPKASPMQKAAAAKQEAVLHANKAITPKSQKVPIVAVDTNAAAAVEGNADPGGDDVLRIGGYWGVASDLVIDRGWKGKLKALAALKKAGGFFSSTPKPEMVGRWPQSDARKPGLAPKGGVADWKKKLRQELEEQEAEQAGRYRAAAVLQSKARQSQAAKDVRTKREEQRSAVTVIQSKVRQKKARRLTQAKRDDRMAKGQHSAATVLQSKARQKKATGVLQARQLRRTEENGAATLLQSKTRQKRAAKDVKIRRWVHESKIGEEERKSATLLQSKARQRRALHEREDRLTQKRQGAATLLQSKARQRAARYSLQAKQEQAMIQALRMELEDGAATVLQTKTRGRQARRSFHTDRVELHAAATVLQSKARQRKAGSEVQHRMRKRDAATVLQSRARQRKAGKAYGQMRQEIARQEQEIELQKEEVPKDLQEFVEPMRAWWLCGSDGDDDGDDDGDGDGDDDGDGDGGNDESPPPISSATCPASPPLKPPVFTTLTRPQKKLSREDKLMMLMTPYIQEGLRQSRMSAQKLKPGRSTNEKEPENSLLAAQQEKDRKARVAHKQRRLEWHENREKSKKNAAAVAIQSRIRVNQAKVKARVVADQRAKAVLEQAAAEVRAKAMVEVAAATWIQASIRRKQARRWSVQLADTKKRMKELENIDLAINTNMNIDTAPDVDQVTQLPPQRLPLLTPHSHSRVLGQLTPGSHARALELTPSSRARALSGSFFVEDETDHQPHPPQQPMRWVPGQIVPKTLEQLEQQHKWPGKWEPLRLKIGAVDAFASGAPSSPRRRSGIRRVSLGAMDKTNRDTMAEAADIAAATTGHSDNTSRQLKRRAKSFAGLNWDRASPMAPKACISSAKFGLLKESRRVPEAEGEAGSRRESVSNALKQIDETGGQAQTAEGPREGPHGAADVEFTALKIPRRRSSRRADTMSSIGQQSTSKRRVLRRRDSDGRTVSVIELEELLEEVDEEVEGDEESGANTLPRRRSSKCTSAVQRQRNSHGGVSVVDARDAHLGEPPTNLWREAVGAAKMLADEEGGDSSDDEIVDYHGHRAEQEQSRRRFPSPEQPSPPSVTRREADARANIMAMMLTRRSSRRLLSSADDGEMVVVRTHALHRPGGQNAPLDKDAEQQIQRRSRRLSVKLGALLDGSKDVEEVIAEATQQEKEEAEIRRRDEVQVEWEAEAKLRTERLKLQQLEEERLGIPQQSPLRRKASYQATLVIGADGKAKLVIDTEVTAVADQAAIAAWQGAVSSERVARAAVAVVASLIAWIAVRDAFSMVAAAAAAGAALASSRASRRVAVSAHACSSRVAALVAVRAANAAHMAAFYCTEEQIEKSWRAAGEHELILNYRAVKLMQRPGHTSAGWSSVRQVVRKGKTKSPRRKK
jgi:Ca2+-binding EF-hand superfamily protein